MMGQDVGASPCRHTSNPNRDCRADHERQNDAETQDGLLPESIEVRHDRQGATREHPHESRGDTSFVVRSSVRYLSYAAAAGLTCTRRPD
jgi:hypothetical protein